MDKVLKILNNAEIDLKKYEICELTDIEKEQMKLNIRKKLIRKKSKRYTKYTTAAAAVLCIVFISAFMGNNVLAGINIFGISIENFFNYKDNSLQDYKAVINKEIIKNGISVKLNEFIIDEDQIIISSTVTSDKAQWQQSDSVFPEVYINGKNIMKNGYGGGSYAKVIDNSTCSFFSSVIPNNSNFMELTGDLRVKVVYDKIRSGNTALKGKWTFEFTYNKDKLSDNVKIIPIDRNFTLEDGAEITIKNLRITPVTTKLEYNISDYLKYHLDFIVKDDNGNELKWLSQYERSGEAMCMFETLNNGIEKLKITPVLQVITPPKEGEHEEVAGSKHILEDQSFEVRTE